MRPRLWLIAASAFLFATPAAAGLSKPEQLMIQTVDAEQERTVSMLETWVNQNSGSLNAPGVEAVGKMLRSELEPLGFKVEWIDMKAAGREGHIVELALGSDNGLQHDFCGEARLAVLVLV